MLCGNITSLHEIAMFSRCNAIKDLVEEVNKWQVLKGAVVLKNTAWFHG